jgi:hypothetical protein
VPGAATLVGTAASGHKVDLTITAPVSNGGLTITKYWIWRCSGSGCTPTNTTAQSVDYAGATTTFTDSGPTGALQTWRYVVYAQNAAGQGTVSNTVSVVTT